MTDQTQNSVAFVAESIIPESPPPARERGIVKWLRANLFSNVTNSILTLATLWLLYLVLSSTLPWIFNGVWTTSSLNECREVLDGKVGACFSVLTERWNQLLYGFKYPYDSYWRPNLALVLLLVAIAPVLFFDLPRKMLAFTVIYPFLAFWLIWGGTLMAPIVAFVGFAAAAAFFQHFGKGSFALGFFGAIVVAFAVWILGGMLIPEGASENAMLSPVPSRDLGGFMLNLMLGVTCVSLSLPLGIALALGRQSDMPLIKWVCVVFIEFVRGVPLITLLFVASVMLSYFFPPESTVDLFLRVVIMITMFSSAYIAEVIRGGLAALPKGQYEAADSLGLDYPQAMRLIILPQALKISIPGIVNVAVGLFKDTTLVSVISMFDLVGMIRGPILASTEWNGVYWELLGAAAALFFVVCYGISQYSQWLERRLATDHR
ncbi:amino acid ABC transporter permease [Tritonibacter horizontis]|uniref:Inner membrane amino-acid ABC transporter permease protein YhdY n=1 Tax=Tritonibacter horizontis TaxID=1768241 RepID=A0A132BVR2_9RHOB|nr:amino acid ABC transporter permease [Tritonibacter horizontis]KUP92152.1 inner membrane amino-acid ABC transporter permease protein YhdY [Tritonibacter horizontis]